MHSNTMMGHKFSFKSHCKKISNENKKNKRSVTSNATELERQCNYYMHKEQMERNVTTINVNDDVMSLDHGMIDSAFIAWDFRSERCRSFNSNLTCTWLDEVQCFSDRDQVSIPQVLKSMNLREIGGPTAEVTTQLMANRVFKQNTSLLPQVNIIKSTCHWYNTKLNSCDFSATAYSIAVVVVGSFRRYLLNSTVHSLLRPMIRLGHDVDYFLSLNIGQHTNKSPRQYSTGVPRTDPIFNTSNNSIESSPESIVSVVTNSIESVGGTLRRIRLYNDTNIYRSNGGELSARRAEILKKHRREDPFTRFPTWDLRNSSRNRALQTNKDLIRWAVRMQELWADVVQVEEIKKNPYALVFFVQDDTFWLNDFNLDRMLANRPAELYTLSCDARVPKMDVRELNDYIAIFTRMKAQLYGTYLHQLLIRDLNMCAATMRVELQKQKQRGCNKEMLFKWILEQNYVQVQTLSQILVPFQRASYITQAPHDTHVCVTKFCQSRILPLDVNITRC